MVDIFNIAGQKVITLTDKTYQAGTHILKWDGRNEQVKEVASGIYFVQMRAEGLMQNRQMVLLR